MPEFKKAQIPVERGGLLCIVSFSKLGQILVMIGRAKEKIQEHFGAI